MGKQLKTKTGRSRSIFVFIIFSLLIFAPVLFIAESLESNAGKDFERVLAKGHIELQNELMQFKLDLVPRNHIEKIVKKVEQTAGLFPAGKARPISFNGEDPHIYDKNTLNRVLKILRNEWQIQPVYMAIIDADAYNLYSWWQKDFFQISPAVLKQLESNLSVFISDVKEIDPITNRSDVLERYWQTRKIAQGNRGTPDDGYYYSFRDAFSSMIYVPPFLGTTYEALSDRFDSKRIFLHANCLKDGEKVYGGYFLLFASKDLPPESILRRSEKSSRKKIKRAYHENSAQNEQTVSIQSLLPSEFVGYSTLFSQKQILPKRLFVSRDFTPEHHSLLHLRSVFSGLKKLVFLFVFFAFFRIYLFGFPLKVSLRRKILLTVSLIVLLPYLLLGHFAGVLLGDMENLRIDETQSELHRYMYELENYYQDQKLQHFFRLFQSKVSFFKKIDVLEDEISLTKSYEFVEPNFYCNFTCYRNDGFARKYRSHGVDRSRADRFFQQLGAKYLDCLGFLDKSSKLARKDLELSGLTDGFLTDLRQGYLEHHTLNSEGIETRDVRKIDDFSRMIFFLIPQYKEADSTIKAIAFGPVQDVKSNIYQLEKFNKNIFQKESLFSQAQLMMGMRSANDLVGRSWPRESNSLFELKRLLNFAGITHSSGEMRTNTSGRIVLSSWKFVKSESEVYSGTIVSNPDKIVELAALSFPLLLIIFTLISIFLFADILGAFFISPVKIFAEGAEKIRGGEYDVRIEIENTDELGALAQSFNHMAEGLQQRDKMRRFVSEDLFLKIKNEGNEAEEAMKTGEMTMLASDIRGFTSLSEKYDAQEVVGLLNDYFTEMEMAITAHGGLITRFVGDAVMAVFYSDEKNSGCFNAIKAAMAMRRGLAKLNCQRRDAGFFLIDNGIGISTGDAVAGIAGSKKGRKVFSVIGDVAKEAEKLEALSKFSKHLKILVCGNTFEKCRDSFSFTPLQVSSENESLIELVGEINGS